MGVAATATVGGSATKTSGFGMGGAAVVGCTVLPVFKHLHTFWPLWQRYVQLRPLLKQEHDFALQKPLQVQRVRTVTPGILRASTATFSDIIGASFHPSWASFNS
jgi:hypothetical protein